MLDRIRRWFRREFLRRLLHPKHAPEYAARASAVGLFVALTPTVGFQVPLVTLIWTITRKFWRFSLPIAIAWTLISNVATVPPLYYLFVVTGRVTLGRWDELRGFDMFQMRLEQTIPDDATIWTALWLGVADLAEVFGYPMLVGCLPWACLGAVTGYFGVLGFIERRRRRRLLRASRRRSAKH